MITASPPIELCRRLLEVPSRAYVAAAAEQIRRILPGDDICWVQCNWDDESFAFWRSSSAARDTAVEQLMPGANENPAVQSLLQVPTDFLPRRMSDLRPRSSEEAAALDIAHEYIGRQQLSMIVDMPTSTVGRSWIATRSSRDFSDDEMDLAARILPALLVLDRLHHPDLAWLPADAKQALTAREHQVVDLLTTGLTAVAIGRILGISQRTVSKHVQNAYNKLGVHDRLLVATGFPRAGRRNTNVVIPKPASAWTSSKHVRLRPAVTQSEPDQRLMESITAG